MLNDSILLLDGFFSRLKPVAMLQYTFTHVSPPEACAQGSGGETWGKETIGETQT